MYVDVDPASLSEDVRRRIIAKHGSYPDYLRHACSSTIELPIDSDSPTAAEISAALAQRFDEIEAQEAQEAAEEAAKAAARKAEKAEEAAQKAAEEAAKAEKAARLLDQIEEWVESRGTDSQRARMAEGLLSNDEIIAAIRADTLSPLDSYKRYQPITKEELKELCETEDSYVDNDAVYRRDDAKSATEAEYAKLVEIRSAIWAIHPTATATLRTHCGEWNCGNHPLHSIKRNGVYIYVPVGEINVTAEYAVD